MRLRHLSALLGLASVVYVLAGCGGGGSGGDTTLKGNTAFRAASVGGYQSLTSGQSYPFDAIRITKPNGSGIPGRAVKAGRAVTPPVYNALLNLYVAAPVVSGNAYVVNVYTDAAATNSAGSVTMTYPSAPPANNAYTTYPVVIQVAVNITGGNLVSAGSFVLTYTGASGANTLTGTLTIPARGITLTLNITLSDSLQVGGSMTIAENGATINIGNLSGSVLGTITGNVSIAPYGWTGTMSISLVTGAYSVNVNTGSGNSTATINSSGSLVIAFADGTGDTVTNPVNAPLASGNGTGGGGGSSSSYTITPVNGNPWEIVSVSHDGKMVGAVGAFNTRDFHYWSSPTAAPQAITLDAGLNNTAVTGVNASGHLVGSGLDPTTQLPVVLYWSANNLVPIRLATPPTPPAGFLAGIPATVLIQSSDKIVATFNTQQAGGAVSYVYSSPADTSPYAVQGGVINRLSEGTAALGFGTNRQDVVWPVLSATATPIAVPEPVSTSTKLANMGADGTIVVTDLGTNIVWYVSGPAYTTKAALSPPTGLTVIAASGVGPSGQVLGTVATSNTSLDNEGLIWATATSMPIVLRTTETPNVLHADFETDSGALIVTCTDSPGVAKYHYSVLTPK